MLHHVGFHVSAHDVGGREQGHERTCMHERENERADDGLYLVLRDQSTLQEASHQPSDLSSFVNSSCYAPSVSFDLRTQNIKSLLIPVLLPCVDAHLEMSVRVFRSLQDIRKPAKTSVSSTPRPLQAVFRRFQDVREFSK